MQHPSRPQPLAFSHVTRPEETWSSDSDSGITADSHSPPSSKESGEGGGGEDPLSWSLLPPLPPSSSSLLLISPDGMSSRGSTQRAGLTMASPAGSATSAAERHRQQDLVHSTLLELERQQRQQPGPPPGHSPHPHHTAHSAASDYVPCQRGRKLRYEEADVTDSEAYREVSERFLAGDFSPPGGGDDGYGTDSRSHTTPSSLSSSLSSLMTDSSSGSQKGGGGGAVRVQPVAGSGRLVIGRRGLLVKRRDLPVPAERTDAVSLEDRLRALTTIQEEDSAPGGTTTAVTTTTTTTNTTTTNPEFPGRQRSDATHSTADPKFVSSSESGSSGMSRSGSGSSGMSKSGSSGMSKSGSSGMSRSGQTCPEGLYSVINKRPSQLHVVSSSRPPSEDNGPDRANRDGREFQSAGVHRAVPVRVEPEGEENVTSRRSAPDVARQTCSGKQSSSCDWGPGGEGRPEVRFKAGGGGVTLNQSGQFQIDYNYYMKASPSESNDDVNTYSPPSSARSPFRGDDSRRRTTPPPPSDHSADEDRYPRWGDFHFYTDLSEEAEGEGSVLQNTAHSQDQEDTEHVYMNVGEVYSSRVSQGSLPNLTLHSGPHSREAPLGHPQCPDRGQSHSSALRQSVSAGSSSLSSGWTGQGNRHSCDVSSLYRLSQTFPPALAVSADRLSINLGDLPRIQEQLRATSQMLLSSSGKRHQFASSSDIYRLFQGGGGGGGVGGFAQGRQPPHRRSFHDFNTSPPLHDLAEVRSRVKANSSPSSARAGTDQSPAATSAGFSPRLPGPLRADHTISVPHTAGLSARRPGNGRGHVNIRASGQARDAAAPPSQGREGVSSLRETLDRGQQFSTDVIHSQDGEQLSTLV